MIEKLQEIIGEAPLGYEFLEYIFYFILVLIGLFVIYKFFSVLFDLYR